MDRLETAHAVTTIDPRGFVLQVLKKGTVETVDVAAEIVSATYQVMGTRKLPLLVDARGVLRQEKGAREYYNGAMLSKITSLSAVAVVYESTLVVFLANLYSSMRKTVTAFKLFSNEKMAIYWLLRQHAQTMEQRARI